MSDKLYIHEDITDWRDEVMLHECVIENDEEIFNQLERGRHTAQVARAAIVSRELSLAPTDLIDTNKALLQTGAMTEISQRMRQRKTQITTSEGKEYDVPAYVGAIPEDDESASYVSAATKEGLERALKYLTNVVPGHIWNRMLIVYQNGGDVQEAAADLHLRIDGMVERLRE